MEQIRGYLSLCFLNAMPIQALDFIEFPQKICYLLQKVMVFHGLCVPAAYMSDPLRFPLLPFKSLVFYFPAVSSLLHEAFCILIADMRGGQELKLLCLSLSSVFRTPQHMNCIRLIGNVIDKFYGSVCAFFLTIVLYAPLFGYVHEFFLDGWDASAFISQQILPFIFLADTENRAASI